MSHYIFLPFLNHPTFHFVSLSNHQIHQQRTKLCCQLERHMPRCFHEFFFVYFYLCEFLTHTDGLFNEKRSSLARQLVHTTQAVARAPVIRRLPAFSGCRRQAALGCGARYSASCIEVYYIVHSKLWQSSNFFIEDTTHVSSYVTLPIICQRKIRLMFSLMSRLVT